MHIPVLISDLAVMLITAGLATILFKRLKQPLVLGYVLAGFLISSYFPFFPTVQDTASIATWSEIGIIFLMFHLGLEFNLHKMATVGSTAIITVFVKDGGTFILGFATGRLLGFDMMDSVFLGGMLSMSSTIITIKAFEELGMKGKRFTELVFGTLVMEDVVGIFMMVILSTISVSKNVSGGEMFADLGVMLLYLVVWLVLGIYFLPTFLNRTIKVMNDEMLLIVSLGVCFGMVMMADFLGFSTALGAFLAGSLLAGTIHMERIEQLTKGVKDLFGATFFLSVGMMVDPETLMEYIVPIIVITIVTIVAKIIFTSLGLIFSGQTLNNSMMSAFSLTQIGEFAFIIATLGMNLGVTGSQLYPIVVAVSVITTFTTPMFIKAAPKAIEGLEKALPDKTLEKLNRYTSEERANIDHDNEWNIYIKNFFTKIVIYGGMMFVVAFVGARFIEPVMGNYMGDLAASMLTCIVTYIIMAFFVGPFINPHDEVFTSLWLKKTSYRAPLMALGLIKVFLVSIIAMVPLWMMFDVRPVWLFFIVVAAVSLVARYGGVSSWYLQLETKFLCNFNEILIQKEIVETGNQTFVYDKLHIISFFAPENAEFLNTTLDELRLGYRYNVYVVKIERDGKYTKHILLPGGDEVIKAGDKVYVVGEERAIYNFYKLISTEPCKRMRTLHQFMESAYPDTENALAVCAVKVTGKESFANKPIKFSNFRPDYDCMILGLQREGLPVVIPNANMLIQKGDLLWVMGSNNNAGRLASEYVEEE